MPLRIRLTAFFTLAAVLVVVLGGWLYQRQLSEGLQDATDASTLGRVVQLQASIDTLAGTDSRNPPPSNTDADGLLTRVVRPNGTVAEESPSLRNVDLESTVARRPGHAVISTRSAGGITYRVLVEPVTRPDGVWTLTVAAPLDEQYEAIDSLEHGLLIAGVLIVALSAGGSWLLGAAALRAVERMRSSVAAMTVDDLDGRVRLPPGRDELAALGATFNALLDRLAHAASRQRWFVADASHELRGPLAVLQMELELADRPQRTREELAAAVRAAADEVERLARLANDLLFLARSDDGQLLVDKSVGPLEPLLRQAIAGRTLTAAEARVEVELRVAPGLRADLDVDRIRQAMDNLLANALRATPPGGLVVVEAASVDGGVCIAVRDSGPGFDATFLPRAFERFSRPDQARTDASGGSGLGLAIVQAVAEAHGGHATAANQAGGGAEVLVFLPSGAGV